MWFPREVQMGWPEILDVWIDKTIEGKLGSKRLDMGEYLADDQTYELLCVLKF